MHENVRSTHRERQVFEFLTLSRCCVVQKPRFTLAGIHHLIPSNIVKCYVICLIIALTAVVHKKSPHPGETFLHCSVDCLDSSYIARSHCRSIADPCIHLLFTYVLSQDHLAEKLKKPDFHEARGQSLLAKRGRPRESRGASFGQKFRNDSPNTCLNTSTPLQNQRPSLLTCANGFYKET
jgi:hypothetical protein